MAMIELADVHKSFGAHHVIRGFSMTVSKGEVVCIVGPSGSGKSTILRCINGLESYDAGSISVEGIRVDRAARSITAVQAAIIGLGIAYSAYQSENFRAGIEAIDKGQVEAAQSIGMGWWLTMRRVLLPQAFRIVLPPYGNIMIMMLKDSSQASTITVAELALQGRLIASSTFQNTTVFTLVAALYLCMSLPLILLVARLEKRFGRA